MSTYSAQYDPRFLRLLRFGPFERRQRGGWRFGTKVISNAVVARLVLSGRARLEGDFVRKAEPAQICAGS
jgi:hypothetical protein